MNQVNVMPIERIVEFWQRHRGDESRYALLNEYGGKRIYRFALNASAEAGTLPSSIIVKTWRADRGTLFDRIKRRTVGQLSGCENEFKILRHLARVAPSLNAPIAFDRFGSERVLGQSGEVVLMSDIGPCQRLIDFLSEAVRNNDSEGINRLQSFLAHSVRTMLFTAQIVDDDHTLINMVRSTTTGEFHRIDFEIARRLKKISDPNRAIGRMLGEILVTHAFGCQPHTKHTTALALALYEALPELNRDVWNEAHRFALTGIEHQREHQGIETHLDLSPIASTT